MVEIWFCLVALLLAAYAVLDGFDLGVGILHRILGRTAEERGSMFAAIGPFWDGNEVCIIAAGGTLFLAFPAVLASALSGFYLAIFMVLWSLILRGLSIELRHVVRDSMWQSFWDTMFATFSALLAFLLGVALANVVRGVPLEADGYFSLSLFTTFLPYGDVGVLDAYTVLAGVFAVVTLAAHGSVYLAWKAESPIAERARALAPKLYLGAAPLFFALTLATFSLRHDMAHAMLVRPLAWLAVLGFFVSVVVLVVSWRRGRDRTAFLASSGLIAMVLAGTGASSFPVMLASTLPTAPSIDAYAAASEPASLRVGLYWWPVSALLVIGYFVIVFRLHRGRLHAESHD